jgi:hypothetical protein
MNVELLGTQVIYSLQLESLFAASPRLIHEIRIHRALIERMIPRHYRQSRLRDVVMPLVLRRIVADHRTLRQMHIAIDNRPLDAAVPPDVHVREDDARVDLRI